MSTTTDDRRPEHPPSTPAAGSETPWQVTQRLRDAAIIAVNELATHLEQVPDRQRYYKANRARQNLWEIE